MPTIEVVASTPDHALSDRALAGLRCTAATLVALPTVRARVRHGDRVVLEVRRDAGGDASPHPILPPCSFHRAVASAHRLRRAGERLALRGIPTGCEPAIEWGVAPGDVARDGAIVRVASDGAWMHVAAVAVPVEACRRAVLGDDGGPPGLGFHADDDVEVTLLHLTTPMGDHVASVEVIDALHAALARVAVAELLDRLGAEVPDTPAVLL
jgi:hypothetical protein